MSQTLSESRLSGTLSTDSRETILVVDDIEGVRDLIREVLQIKGYRVLVAGNGIEALQVAEKHGEGIDLLLTDVVMPEMGGPELALQFQNDRPATKVIFISGYSDEAITRHGVLQPGTTFIKKPFTSEALTRRVREELDRAS